MSGNNHNSHQGHGEANNKYLPDWDKAERHRLASKVGTYNEEDTNVCECCRQTINKTEIPLCQGTKTLEFLGFGFPLFYMFLRYCILLLFLLFATQGIISIYISVQEGVQYCSQNQSIEQATVKHNSILHLNYFGQQNNAHLEEAQAAKTKKLYLSKKCNNILLMLARTQKKQVNYEVIFRISSFMIQIIFLLYTKDMLLKMLDYYDERESDLSDFTVMIKSIPKGKSGIKKKLLQFMNNHFFPDKKDDKTDTQYIHEVILISDVKAIEKATQFFHTKLEHYLQHPTQENLQHLKEAQQIKKQIARQTIDKIRADTIQSKELIVIFETQKKKFEFLEYANLEDKNLILAGYYQSPHPIIVQEAPQPRQINYENLQYQNTRTSHILKGWGLSLLFLSIITVVFYFIQLVKSSKMDTAIQQLQENPNSSDAKTNKIIAGVIAWSCLVGIVLFNKFVMGRVLHYFTHLEHHDNKAHEYFSFAFKYAIGMFFTTAVMTILVQAFKFKNYYSHDWGVIEQESIMFILCAFIIPLIWTINPWQLCHVMQRNKHFQSKHISQHEANHLMADYHYDMGKRCAQIIQMMWFTCLYVDLIPIGTILIPVGLIIYYWIDKYNLLRRASIDGNMSGSIILGCMKLLDANLLWRSLGQLIFDIQIRQGVRLQTLIFLGISIIYLLMPWNDILDTVNNEDFKLNQKTFTSQQHRFVHDDYKNHHPIYKAAFSQNIQFGKEDIQALSIFDFTKTLIEQKNQHKQPGILQQQKLLQGDILNVFGKAPTKAAKS